MSGTPDIEHVSLFEQEFGEEAEQVIKARKRARIRSDTEQDTMQELKKGFEQESDQGQLDQEGNGTSEESLDRSVSGLVSQGVADRRHRPTERLSRRSWRTKSRVFST